MPSLVGDQNQIASQSDFDPDLIERDKVGGESIISGPHNATNAINKDDTVNLPPNMNVIDLGVKVSGANDDERQGRNALNDQNQIKIVKNDGPNSGIVILSNNVNDSQSDPRRLEQAAEIQAVINCQRNDPEVPSGSRQS